MIRRRRLQQRRVDALQQMLEVRGDIASRRRVARIDHERAARAQVRVHLRHSGCRQWLRIAWHGVVDHGIEFETVARQIDAMRFIRLHRRPRAKLIGQAPQPGGGCLIKPPVASLHVRKAQVGGGLARHLLAGQLRRGGRRDGKRDRGSSEQRYRAGYFLAAEQARQATRESERDQQVERDDAQRQRDHPSAKARAFGYRSLLSDGHLQRPVVEGKRGRAASIERTLAARSEIEARRRGWSGASRREFSGGNRHGV